MSCWSGYVPFVGEVPGHGRVRYAMSLSCTPFGSRWGIASGRSTFSERRDMNRRSAIAALAVGTAAVAVLASTVAADGSPGRDDNERALVQAMHDHHLTNVILLIGDGMGTQEITAARYYQGVHNKLNVDRMPLTGFDTSWSVKPAAKPPYLPDYDPDSASTGTMWATGHKPIDERI